MIAEIIKIGLLLIAILDPFLATPPFVAMTRKMKNKERTRILLEAIVIAGIILIVSLLLGSLILDFFGITIPSFKVAGGIVLFIVGLRLVLGYDIIEHKKEKSTIALLLGTPLLAGPAAITTIILMTHDYGYIESFLGLLLSLVATYAIMFLGSKLVRAVGKKGVTIFSRVMGLILAAFAIEFIRTGLIAMIP